MYVGLTGGIGSGKSTFAGMLADFGAVVIDADEVARAVVDDAAEQIAAQLGIGIMDSGRIDRIALAERVFRDPRALAVLEGIVHPEVARRVAARRADLPANAVVVYDVALLVEKDLAGQFDQVVVVQAPLEQRLERLAKRGLTREQSLARMAQQASDEQRAAVADIVIDNDGTLERLREAAAGLWRTLAP